MIARFARQPTLVGTDAAEPPHKLLAGCWIDAADPERLEGVLTHSSAEMLNVKLGDELNVSASGNGAAGLALPTRCTSRLSELPNNPKLCRHQNS